MVEGSGSGSVPLTNGSGSRMPKNMWIRWIRIRNTDFNWPDRRRGRSDGQMPPWGTWRRCRRAPRRRPWPPGSRRSPEDDEESIVWVIEGQAFSQSYNLAPRPLPLSPPLPSVSSTSDSQESQCAQCSQEREGEGGGRGAESYDRKKDWSPINHSILSGSNGNLMWTVSV